MCGDPDTSDSPGDVVVRFARDRMLARPREAGACTPENVITGNGQADR